MSSDAPEADFSPELLEQLFSAAAELAPGQRDAFLDRRCVGQPELRRAIDELLRSSERAASATLWQSPALVQEGRRAAGDSSLPFERLGPYQVLSRIGMGGMGTVYLAEREDDGIRRRVAIKIVPHVLASPESLGRFQQERRILAGLEHPHIALMLDAGRTPDDMPYLVMQYVEGRPIDQYAAEKHLSIADRLALFRAVLSAAGYAHSRQIVHRDIKPNNILVTPEGVPKLLDFGIAKLVGDAQTTGRSTAVMTPGYASPEQLSGQPVTNRSDIYSLGVLLYEVLTGARLEPAASGGDPPPPSSVACGIGPALDAAVIKALQRDPRDRYSSVAEFDRALANCVDGSRPRASRWPMAAAAGALAMAAAAAWYFLTPAAAAPRVSVRVVAHKAEYETRYAFDEQRLFFVERNSFTWTLAQVPLDGGPVVRIPTPFITPTVFDISPDHSHLLLGEDANKDQQELWAMSTAGGVPQRLGSLTVHDAAWSPDGRRLVYTLGPKLYSANPDGSDSHLIAEIPCDYLDWPRWSPDQKFLRVTANFPRQLKTAIWQVSADGREKHAWLPQWPADRTCCGTWIASGRYYVFQARMKAEIQIWGYDEGSLLRRPGREPFQLTAGPNFMGNPVGELRSDRVYTLDRSPLAELDRYDAPTNTAGSYLGGVSARFCAFSRDGKQMSYVTFPGRELWRRSVDGSQTVQLTKPPFRPLASRWFPDGRRLIMEAEMPGKPSKLYVLSVTGGKPEPLLDEDWTQAGPDLSPDGQTVAFGRWAKFDPPAKVAIYLYGLNAHTLAEIPGSSGFGYPRWSPDGRYLAAGKTIPDGRTSLMLWDFQTKSWSNLTGPETILNVEWSRDSHYVYYGCTVDSLNAICRIGVPGGRAEVVVRSWKFHREDTTHSEFAGLTPDGSPLFTQIYKDFDVSALRFEFPR